MSNRLDEYFVLREGSTLEEQWSWDEIADRCRSGEFTADTRVYLPDESRWVAVAETDLGEALAAAMAQDETADDADEELEREYEDALAQLDEEQRSVDPWIDAACLACELGRAEEAYSHFQKALDLHPFHPRVANEARRRLSRADCRRLRMLERPEAAWEDLGEVVGYPFARGPVYLLPAAGVFAALSFLPGGGITIALLALLWCYRSMRSVAAGAPRPVPWGDGLVDPVHNIVIPGAAMAAVLGEWLGLFWVFARVGMLIEGKADISVLSYIGSSPVLMIALTLCAVVYLPAVMVAFDSAPRAALGALSPWTVVRNVARMRGEYAMTLVLLFALAFVYGAFGFVATWVPVAGKLVWAASGFVVALAAAHIMGRLRARVAHIMGW